MSKQSIIEWDSESFNYLAIGNSITVHGICDYWWNERGMAATEKTKDYFHIVSAYLNARSKCINFSVWEMMANDRSEAFSLLDDCLSDEIDLITLQLGENVSDLTTFDADFKELIIHLQKKCPNAQIIMIGDYWYKEGRTEVKKKIAKSCGIDYIGLEEIMDDDNYMCGIGTTVYGDANDVHIVDPAGVALHPNDKAMEYIAGSIIKKQNKKRREAFLWENTNEQTIGQYLYTDL